MISISSWSAAMHRCVVRAIACPGAVPSGTNNSAFGWWNCMRLLRSLLVNDRWQTGGGECLPVTLLFFVGNMKADAFREFGKLFLQHGVGGLQNQVAALAGHHAPQHQKIAELVVVGI